MNIKAHRIIAHIVYRFGHGGLENGLVNLINQMYVRGYGEDYRHVIICITDHTRFHERLADDSVHLFDLNKHEGKDPGYYRRLIRLLRTIKPDIVHSRNLPALECAVVARISGIPGVIHGEHGWDVHDLNGTVRRYRYLRRLSQPFIHRYVALSRDIERWLVHGVGIRPDKVVRICNGVDTNRFRPSNENHDMEKIRIGYVGRLEAVKNPGFLIDAYARMLDRYPELRHRTTLELIGDGSLRDSLENQVRSYGISSNVVFFGMREDVPEMLRRMHIYVLPSLNEGISNSILEAMASGLPIVATDVGGNPELVLDGVNGFLVQVGDVDGMAECIHRYCVDPELRSRHASSSRDRAVTEFSIDGMVDHYVQLYHDLTSNRRNKG